MTRIIKHHHLDIIIDITDIYMSYRYTSGGDGYGWGNGCGFSDGYGSIYHNNQTDNLGNGDGDGYTIGEY